jgi:general stress protein 26
MTRFGPLKGTVMQLADADRLTLLSILRDNREHAVLATCDGGQPDVRIMAPFIEDDLTLWLVTGRDSRKMVQLKANPRLGLLFVDIPGYAREAKISGEAVFIDDPAEKRRVWDLFTDLERYFPGGPDSPEYCVLRVAVTRIDWRDSPSGKIRVYTP